MLKEIPIYCYLPRWLTSKDTLALPEKIEEVNEIMLTRRIKTENDIFVFFYEDDDIFAQRLLKVLEMFDNKLDKKNIDFVKISDDGIDKVRIKKMKCFDKTPVMDERGHENKDDVNDDVNDSSF